MRGAFSQFVKSKGYAPSVTSADATERAAALHKEQCELRLARIQNGKHPDYKNGHGTKKG
jgi:hypothetical protein